MQEGILRFEDELYPPLLRMIPQPPKLLYYRGDPALAAAGPCVAMVGARRATEYGKYVAAKMAGRFAENGITVVSGMAAGIDSCSHKGALDAGGKTIAVLGNSLEICFPLNAKNLKKDIEEKGLLLSEYPPGTHGTKFTFPHRNRIISGLCLATVVVEAGLNSGSLITAEIAAEQGRDIYAVPGNITSVMSIGTNRLIQDGAAAVAVIDDIVNDFVKAGVCEKHGGPSNIMKELGKDEKTIYDFLSKNGEISLDNLALALGKSPAELAPVMTILEMKGLVQTALGKIFIAN